MQEQHGHEHTGRLCLGDLIDATGARVQVDPSGADLSALRALAPARVLIDSRQIGPGDLFVALPGTRTDGARFAGDAFARGALAALTTEPVAVSAEQRAARAAVAGDAHFVALLVSDPLAALQRAAAAWRARHPDVCVIGITGSVGKTSTREAIAAVLDEAVPVLVSPRSYNNEIGLPLTLLGLTGAHRAAVLEMGMYAPGEITALAEIARPHIAVVTMVAPVHLERLGSIEAIAAAKSELPAALPPDGVAILNGDDERVRAMTACTRARAVLYGLGEHNTWRALDLCDRGLDGFSFTLARDTWRVRIETAIVGRHFVYALLAAAAVAEALGLAPDVIAGALGRVQIGERQRILRGPRDLLIIDDTWNASPPSMLAALDVLAATPRRHVAVLGDMRELGAESERAHREIGRRAGAAVQALVTVGENRTLIADAARQAGLPAEAIRAVPDRASVPAALGELLQPGDAVLLKGSRALYLEEVVQWLLQG